MLTCKVILRIKSSVYWEVVPTCLNLLEMSYVPYVPLALTSSPSPGFPPKPFLSARCLSPGYIYALRIPTILSLLTPSPPAPNPETGIFLGSLGAPTSSPQEGRLPSGLLVWGPPDFFFLGTDLYRILIKDSAWGCHWGKPPTRPEIYNHLTFRVKSLIWPLIKGPWIAFCISKLQCHHLYKESNVFLVALSGRSKEKFM